MQCRTTKDQFSDVFDFHFYSLFLSGSQLRLYRVGLHLFYPYNSFTNYLAQRMLNANEKYFASSLALESDAGGGETRRIREAGG